MEERYARGAAFFRRWMMGLFTFTMMMKTESIKKSRVMEIRTFCMQTLKQAGCQVLATLVSPCRHRVCPAKLCKIVPLSGTSVSNLHTIDAMPSLPVMVQLRLRHLPRVPLENNQLFPDGELRLSRKRNRLQRFPSVQIPCRKTVPVKME